MKGDHKDQELRRHFEKLKTSIEASTPPFEQLWSKAQRRKQRSSIRRWVSIAAAAVAAILSGWYFFQMNTPLPAPELAEANILQWEAPTDEVFQVSELSITKWKAATDVLLKTNEEQTSLKKRQ